MEPPWRGPYKIVNKYGNVNYEIELPLGDRTHKIVHLQHLKQWIQPSSQDLENIQENINQERELSAELEAVISERPMTRSMTRLKADIHGIDPTNAKPNILALISLNSSLQDGLFHL